jgi:hypothetical protein
VELTLSVLKQLAFLVIIVFVNFPPAFCQSDSTFTRKQIALTFSIGSFYSNPFGGGLYYSTRFSYQLTNERQISLYYINGQGLSGLSFGEPNPESYKYIDLYNEIASLYSFSLGENKMLFCIGTGIGVMWGTKGNHDKYSWLIVPVEAGPKYCFSKSVSAGIGFHVSITSKTIFRGVDFNFSIMF